VEVSVMIAGIDAEIKKFDTEIKKLQEARNILKSISAPTSGAKLGRGRPKGSTNAVLAAAAKVVAAPKKRKLSPEGRKAIADAMKRRWAERRKTAVKAVAK